MLLLTMLLLLPVLTSLFSPQREHQKDLSNQLLQLRLLESELQQERALSESMLGDFKGSTRSLQSAKHEAESKEEAWRLKAMALQAESVSAEAEGVLRRGNTQLLRSSVDPTLPSPLPFYGPLTGGRAQDAG